MKTSILALAAIGLMAALLFPASSAHALAPGEGPDRECFDAAGNQIECPRSARQQIADYVLLGGVLVLIVGAAAYAYGERKLVAGYDYGKRVKEGEWLRRARYHGWLEGCDSYEEFELRLGERLSNERQAQPRRRRKHQDENMPEKDAVEIAPDPSDDQNGREWLPGRLVARVPWWIWLIGYASVVGGGLALISTWNMWH